LPTIRPKKLKVVRVDWLDAFGGVIKGWDDIDVLTKGKPIKAVTFGVLLSKTKEKVVVCPHLAGDAKEIDLDTAAGDGAISIPAKWIVKITNLGIL